MTPEMRRIYDYVQLLRFEPPIRTIDFMEGYKSACSAILMFLEKEMKKK